MDILPNLRQLVDYIHALTHILTNCHSDNWSIINTNLSGVSPACHEPPYVAHDKQG